MVHVLGLREQPSSSPRLWRLGLSVLCSGWHTAKKQLSLLSKICPGASRGLLLGAQVKRVGWGMSRWLWQELGEGAELPGVPGGGGETLPGQERVPPFLREAAPGLMLCDQSRRLGSGRHRERPRTQFRGALWEGEPSFGTHSPAIAAHGVLTPGP